MKKVFTSALAILSTIASFAQSTIYSPATIANGSLTQPYSATVSFTIPATATIQTSTLGIPSIPGLPIPASVPADITSTILTVAGLPTGVTGVFSNPNGNYAANESGTLTLSGTPTASGSFSIAITSVSNGSFTIQGQSLSFPGTVPILNTAIPPAPGVFDYTYSVFVSDPNSIEDLDRNNFSVIQNMPNPFNGNTTIAFSTPVASKVSLKVFDMLGKEISTISIQAKSGINEFVFDGSNLKEGIYFYNISNGTKAFTQKMQVK